MDRRLRYRYILSLPERAIRSLGAVSGGLLKEIGDAALPAAIRRTILYRTMVDVTLRLLIEDVGEVEGIYASENKLAENFILQRTASHSIELLGILAFRASPVWILAALADVAGGGQKLIREIVESLKDEGLLDKNAQFETMDQILTGIEKASGHLALTLNLPPLNVTGLRREWETFRSELKSIPPSQLPAPELLERTWEDLTVSAKKQKKTPFALSSLIAVSTLSHVPSNLLWLSKAARSVARRTTGVVGAAVLDHYAATLAEIERAGFSAYWKQEFRPYLRAAAEQFSREHLSITERLMQRRGSDPDAKPQAQRRSRFAWRRKS